MDEENLKTTPCNARHIELGGKMVPFAGWSMPVQYFEGILKEHETTRTHAGIFDISHMGEFMAEGKDTIPFLQYMVTNDLNLMENNKAQYANMCYPNGTVVDDLFYYRESPEKFRIIVNGANVEKDWKWLQEHRGKFNVKLTDLSKTRARFAYQGPKAQELLTPAIDAKLANLKRFYFTFAKITKAGKSIPVFIARTGYTGEDGFEMSCEVKDAVNLYNILLETGAKPIGLGARDSLRLEACYSLYGHELSDHITPIEASIGWAVKPKEGIDYIGKSILMKQKADGTTRVLVGLNLKDRGIIREHCDIYKGTEKVGYVTSGGFGPTLKKTIGLALVKRDLSVLDTELEVEIREKRLKAVIVKTPFYKRI